MDKFVRMTWFDVNYNKHVDEWPSIDATGPAIPLEVEPLDAVFREVELPTPPPDPDFIALRSCWLCNPAHEHLKSAPRLFCFVCGCRFEYGAEVG